MLEVVDKFLISLDFKIRLSHAQEIFSCLLCLITLMPEKNCKYSEQRKNSLFWMPRPGGANLGSFDFCLFSLSIAAP